MKCKATTLSLSNVSPSNTNLDTTKNMRALGRASSGMFDYYNIEFEFSMLYMLYTYNKQHIYQKR